jgi:putative transposase
VKRLRHLEQKNAKLKKLVAERDLEIDVMRRSPQENGDAQPRRSQNRLRAKAWRIRAQGTCAAVVRALDELVELRGAPAAPNETDRGSGLLQVKRYRRCLLLLR